MTTARCNCSPLGERVYTKPPCPVHDTPERLARLSEVIVPRTTSSVRLADMAVTAFYQSTANFTSRTAKGRARRS